MFIGEYHYTIDDKGRITIPAKIRYELGEECIVTRGLDNCLFLYPKDRWNELIDTYQSLPNVKDARNFMRFFLSGANRQGFDKQGRINISIPLIKYAALDKECVIIGVGDHLEIWDYNKWNEFISSNECEFSNMADKLFSGDLNA